VHNIVRESSVLKMWLSWRTDIGDVQHDIMQQILHIFNTLDSRTILCARGTIVFSQSLNWELTTDVMAGPWKGGKMKSGSNKEVAILQDHRRKRDLFEGLAGNFPLHQWLSNLHNCWCHSAYFLRLGG
jgi:hypothetical protein